jgi:uncharacterized membrane protein HdeD (DUF308 family)
VLVGVLGILVGLYLWGAPLRGCWTIRLVAVGLAVGVLAAAGWGTGFVCGIDDPSAEGRDPLTRGPTRP